MVNLPKLYKKMRQVVVVVQSKPPKLLEEEEEDEEKEKEEEKEDREEEKDEEKEKEKEGEGEWEWEEEEEEEEEKEQEETLLDDGSLYAAGVVINEHGFILTCAHLVPREFEVSIRGWNDEDFQDASVYLYDTNYDLAIIRTRAHGSPGLFCEFGCSSVLHFGMRLYSIAHPDRLAFSMIQGDVGHPKKLKEEVPFLKKQIYYSKYPTPKKSSFILINNMNGLSTSHGAPVFDSRGRVLGLDFLTCHFDFAIRPQPLKKFVNLCKKQIEGDQQAGDHI